MYSKVSCFPLVFWVALCVVPGAAQSRARDLTPILGTPLETPDVVSFQLRQSVFQKITPLHGPQSAAAWTKEVERIRKHLLDDVVFHGWPAEWVNAPPLFEDLGV